MGQGAVLTMCSVAASNLDEWHICSGAPAITLRKRVRG